MVKYFDEEWPKEEEMLNIGFSVVAVTTDLVLLRNAIDEIGQLAKNN